MAGKPPILHYELGNENWGQGNTDWPPEVYGKTCEVFANAFRKALSDAQATHSALAGLKLYMVAVGYPTMGNNQDAFKASNRDVNVRWTREMNRLADLKSIDAVQEHFYPYGGADGGTLLWTVHNLTNILCLRNGVPNPRLGGYRNPELAYKLPMEWTEWNVKCWGPLPDVSLPLVNADFTAGAKNWTVQIEPAGAGAVSFERAAARRGPKGLQIKTQASAKQAEVRQILSVASRKPAAAFGAAAWVRTDRPAQTRVLLRQTNDGPSKGIVLGSATATQTNMWERITATGAPKADTTDLEVVLQVEGGGATAWFDEIQPIHWSTFSGVAPLVNTRFEQQLFIVDALRVLLAWPTPRTHLHHLIGDYPCTTLTSKGAARDNAAAFQFLNKRIGDRVVKSDCEVPTFAYNTNADAYATDFNALAPDMTNVPALSVLAMRDGQRLYVLLVNRTTDRTIQANLDFGATTLSAKGDLRTLAGSDFDVSGAAVRTQSVEVVNPLSLAVPPHCAQMLSVGLGEK